MNAAPRPFLKWAGGKAKLAQQIIERFPKSWNPKTDLYVEPFLGGGAVFFALQPKRAILNDANQDLMNTWRTLQENPSRLIATLQGFEENYRRDPEVYYLQIREAGRVCGEIGNAARVIFLNKTCFNGLYRVNAAERFNVPWGKNPKATICDADNLRLCSAALRGMRLRWENALDRMDPVLRGYDPAGATIYCDPPYCPTTASSNFTAYTPGGFTYADQIRLLDRAVEWRELGAHVILSQAADESLIEQYRRCGFTCEPVQARRNINSKGNRRGCVTEYIIS